MPANTYRVTEIVGTSEIGVDDAIKSAIADFRKKQADRRGAQES